MRAALVFLLGLALAAECFAAGTYQRFCEGTGTSVSCDIGTSGNSRLVHVTLLSELDTPTFGVTVAGQSCTSVVQSNGFERWAEHFRCNETAITGYSGSQTVACTGCSSSDYLIVVVFYNVFDGAANDSGVSDTGTTCSVTNIDVSAGGVYVHSGMTRVTGKGPTGSWTSPGVEIVDADNAGMTTVAAYGEESSAQTNKTYEYTLTSSGQGRCAVSSYDGVAAGGSSTATLRRRRE